MKIVMCEAASQVEQVATFCDLNEFKPADAGTVQLPRLGDDPEFVLMNSKWTKYVFGLDMEEWLLCIDNVGTWPP